MSAVELVTVEREDLDAFSATVSRLFGEAARPHHAHLKEMLDRSTLARIDGADVGTAAVVDFQLTVPGGARVRMDGVTVVVVAPVARRRGVLRAMMNRLIDEARDRGAAVLGLGATESSIYRRFGYGVASHVGTAEIDTAHAATRVPIDTAGRLRSLSVDEALPVWLDVESRQTRVGSINRRAAVWTHLVAVAEEQATSKGIAQVVVHEGRDGVIDGFVNYRQEGRWRDEVADGIVDVHALCALTREAHLALWQHVLQLDLAEHLVMNRFWLDDPIQHVLADPRRLRVVPRDDIHLRVVDAVALLQSRRYSREETVVIEVRDDACPDVVGRYRVEGGLDGAAASTTATAADLVMDAAALGSLMLGDVSVAALHAAGLVEELRGGAVQRASAMFAWSPRPHLTYMF